VQLGNKIYYLASNNLAVPFFVAVTKISPGKSVVKAREKKCFYIYCYENACEEDCV
jgi:hypothetical protein